MDLSSHREIPLVDLASSQEEFEDTNSKKRKETEPVTILDSPGTKRPKPCNGSPSTSAMSPTEAKDNLAIITQRINNIEKHFYQHSSETVKTEESATKQEFHELCCRVDKIEERIEILEQMFESMKSALSGFPSTTQSKKRPGQFNQNTEEPTTSKKQEKKGAGTQLSVIQGPSTSTKPISSGNVAPKIINSKDASRLAKSLGAVAPKRPVLNSSNINDVNGQNCVTPFSSVVPTPSKSTEGTLNCASKISSHPSNNAGDQPSTFHPNNNNNQSKSTSSLSIRVVEPVRRSSQLNGTLLGRDRPTISELKRNVTHILKQPGNKNEPRNTHNYEELPEGTVLNIRIKQELYDNSYHQLDKIDAACFRKDLEGRTLVYIDGGGRKFRSQNKYAAIGGLSLSETWFRILPFVSDLESTTMKAKEGKAIQTQAEILAAYFALEDVKIHEPGSSKVKIVTNCEKLLDVMSRRSYFYPGFDVCKCQQFPCSHGSIKWNTFDYFASMYSDDLPRLILASLDFDVKWNCYLDHRPREEQDRKMREHFKTKINAEIKSLMEPNPRRSIP